MTQIMTQPEQSATYRADAEELLGNVAEEKAARERRLEKLRLLWTQRRFLLRITGVGCLAVAALAFVIPSQYESIARLMPPDNQSSNKLALLAALAGNKAASGLGTLAGDFLGLKNTGALFVGVLQSRTIKDRLIGRHELRKVYRVKRWEDARKKLARRTDVTEDRKSGIIKITVTDRDPQRATALAGSYVTELNRLVAELTTSSAHRERVFLEERLKAVKQELDRSAQEFSEFASKNTAIDIKEQGKAMVESAAILQGQLIATQAELEGLKQIYTDNNVRVRAARARVAELQRQIEKLGGKDDKPSGPGDQESAALYPSIRKLPLLGVKWADLYRQTRIQEVVFETLTQAYELAKVEEAKEIPTVKVLDSPNVPEKKSFPPRLLITLFGTSLTLALAAVWVLERARWETIDPQDPGKVLANEVFSSIKAQALRASPNGNLHLGMNWLRRRRRRDKPVDKEEVD